LQYFGLAGVWLLALVFGVGAGADPFPLPELPAARGGGRPERRLDLLPADVLDEIEDLALGPEILIVIGLGIMQDELVLVALSVGRVGSPQVAGGDPRLGQARLVLEVEGLAGQVVVGCLPAWRVIGVVLLWGWAVEGLAG
jgi:hypothetical protein